MSAIWEGAEQIVANLRKAQEAKTRGARRGLQLALRNVLNVSNKQVPHEEGDLERDGGTSMDDGDAIRGAISYGRSADTKDYAVVQHEDMTLSHDGGRNAKFLEHAMMSTRQQNAEILATAIRREMGT